MNHVFQWGPKEDKDTEIPSTKEWVFRKDSTEGWRWNARKFHYFVIFFQPMLTNFTTCRRSDCRYIRIMANCSESCSPKNLEVESYVIPCNIAIKQVGYLLYIQVLLKEHCNSLKVLFWRNTLIWCVHKENTRKWCKIFLERNLLLTLNNSTTSTSADIKAACIFASSDCRFGK